MNMKMKIDSLAIALAAALTLGLGTTPAPASANAAAAGQFLKDNWGWIVGNLWTPFTKQVYITSLSPQETQAVKREFNRRADGELKARCVNKIADVYLGREGWRLKNTPNRFILAPMVEQNGQANCFLRMERKAADRFILRRGW